MKSSFYGTSANLHFSSQVSCVFLCFRVSGNTETQQHGKYVTITLEVNNDQPLDICVSQRKGHSCCVSQFLVFLVLRNMRKLDCRIPDVYLISQEHLGLFV